MEELKEKIKKELLNLEVEKENKEIELYKELINELFIDKNVDKPDPISFFMLAFNTRNDKSFDENYKKVESLSKNKIFKKNILLTELIEYLSNMKEYELLLLLEILEQMNKSFIDKWLNKKIIENNKEKLKEKKAILDLLERNNIPTNDSLKFVTFYQECSLSERKAFEWTKSYTIILSNETWKIFKEELKKIKIFLEDYLKKIERNKKNKIKNNKDMKSLYLKRLKELNDRKQETYLEIQEEELQKYPIELLEEMEYHFSHHNKKIIEKLDKKIANYNENKINTLKETLLNYHIVLQEEQLKEIIKMEIKKEELEDRIKKYKSLNIENNILFMYLLKKEKVIFEIILDLIITKSVSINFLIQNKGLEANDILKMKEKKDYLKGKGIKMSYLDIILLLDQKEIISKIELSKKYQLKSLEGICKDFFFETLDIWIERGLYPHFETNKEIIEEDFVTITKRILIGQKLKLPIFDESGKILSLFKEEKKFYIKNKDLDFYLANYTNYFIKEQVVEEEERRKFILMLENNFYKDPLTYEINNILISRPKVLRNMEKNIDCVSKVIHGSILESEECETIKKEVEERLHKYSLTNTKNSL